MTTGTKCAACDGLSYGKTGGSCRDCRGTGRAHVPCAACEGRSFISGVGSCLECRGRGRLDVVVDARVIDMQRERASKAVAATPEPRRAPPVETLRPRRRALVEDAPETRVERDEDAETAAREAWRGHEGSQVRRAGRRARAA